MVGKGWTMYRCEVELRVWRSAGASSGHTLLRHVLEVAESPKVGLELHEGRWFSGTLTRVVWNVDKECFHCRVADELPLQDRDYDYSHDWLVANFLQQGWQRDGGDSPLSRL